MKILVTIYAIVSATLAISCAPKHANEPYSDYLVEGGYIYFPETHHIRLASSGTAEFIAWKDFLPYGKGEGQRTMRVFGINPSDSETKPGGMYLVSEILIDGHPISTSKSITGYVRMQNDEANKLNPFILLIEGVPNKWKTIIIKFKDESQPPLIIKA